MGTDHRLTVLGASDRIEYLAARSPAAPPKAVWPEIPGDRPRRFEARQSEDLSPGGEIHADRRLEICRIHAARRATAHSQTRAYRQTRILALPPSAILNGAGHPQSLPLFLGARHPDPPKP